MRFALMLAESVPRPAKGLFAAACCLVLALVLVRCPAVPPTPVATGGVAATGGAPGVGGQATGGDVDAGSPAAGGEPAVCRYLPSRGARSRIVELPRVINGQPSPDGAFPWAVALETQSGWQYCGASVIDQRWLLSAAHCQVEPGEVAHLGSVDLRNPGRRLQIIEVLNHWLWYDTTSGWDVALLRLEADAGVEPIEIAPPGTPDPAVLRVVGWGAQVEGGSTTPIQQYADMPFVSHATCAITYPALDETMFCAGGPLPDDGSGLLYDACQGDSGGPVVWQSGDGWRLFGPVSWGRGCARPGTPGVNTDLRLQALADWVAACAR